MLPFQLLLAASTVAAGVVIAASLLAYVRGGRWSERTLQVALLAGVALAVATAARRAVLVDHFPGQSPSEVAVLWASVALACGLSFQVLRDPRARAFAALVAGWIATVALARAMQLPSDPHDLPPALRSAWLPVHVMTIVTGEVLVLVAAACSLVRLQRPCSIAFAIGFPALTVGLVSGTIWAQNAWSSYWGWDARETTALVAWIVLFAHGVQSQRAPARGSLVTGAVLVLAGTLYGYLPAAQKSIHRFTDYGVHDSFDADATR